MKTVVNHLQNDTILYDLKLMREGYTLIGVDEVGRGPLAGPVVASALYIPESLFQTKASFFYLIKDSKKFTSQKQKNIRAELAEILTTHCHSATVEISVEEINSINILRASLLAMEIAVRNLVKTLPNLEKILVLVDGKHQLNLGYIKQVSIKQGDTLSLCIAGASIIAKEYRDQLMKDLAKQFPLYGWDHNSGYPTKFHREAIIRYGKTIHHRNFKVKLV